MTAEIRRVAPGEWQALRDVRLAALQDAPDAFGSTYEETATRPEAWWVDWAARAAGPGDDAVFLAWDAGDPVGIAGSFHRPHDGRWLVFTMWVDPAHRGGGLARALLDAVTAFQRSRGATEAFLDVSDGNDAARALYERYGFVDTGSSEPLRPGSSVTIREMKLRLEI